MNIQQKYIAAFALVFAVTGQVDACGNSNWPEACTFTDDNPYDWEFVAPACDTANPSHLFITSIKDWDKINDPQYKVFCVQPNDYRTWSNGAVLNLTAKGTNSNPRWILLYNPNNPSDTRHPVQIDAAERAIMPHFKIIGGEYWQIYRMTVKGYAGDSGDIKGTTGVRFSHLLIEEGKKTAFPRVVGSNGNYVFQYNVHRNIVPDANGTDRVAFYIETCDFQPCVIVRNEIINPASDAIQVAASTYHGGLRIDDNEMYMTDARRTNCETGNPDPNGLCATNEMMIVFKAPTVEPAQPSYVTNNLIHHSYYFDGISCCTSSAQPAPAINIGSGLYGTPNNIIVENNIIFESSQGIDLAHNGTLGAKNITVKRNLFYKIDPLVSKVKNNAALRTHLGFGNIEHHNVVVDSITYLMTTSGFSKNHQCNVAIDAGDVSYFSTKGIWENNYLYGRGIIKPGTGYARHGSSADSRNSGMCFQINRLTNTTTYCIPYGAVSADSPHVNCTLH